MALANVIAPPLVVEEGQVTPSNNYSFATNKIRKYGEVVSVIVRCTTNITPTTNAWVTLGTIPEGFRPTQELDIEGSNNKDDTSLHMRVYTTGTIAYYGKANVTCNPYFTLTYVM